MLSTQQLVETEDYVLALPGGSDGFAHPSERGLSVAPEKIPLHMTKRDYVRPSIMEEVE